LDSYQPRDHSRGLESGSVGGDERSAGDRADGLFGVPLAQSPGRRLDRGRRPDRSDPNRHQPDCRLPRLGPGPDPVVVKTTEHIVVGLLVNQVWSLGGVESGPGGKRYATFLAEPFVNYNFGHGWFVSSAPIITDDEAHAGRKWTVPVGAVAGRIIKLGGKLPVKLSIGGYYNVVTPQYGAKWQLQSVVAAIF
jgi:hypothetical protein